MRIGVIDVFVDDQDKARKFYTEVLGFDVKADAAYSETDRWLTVVSPDDPDGTQLMLERADSVAEALQRARWEAGRPTISLTTDDSRRAYDELTARGAVFRSEPQRMPYGGTDAVFEDGCGNLLNLHED
jgi:catechol 2,3-dioxygenase-like lactoylglutathione lyase family enzyme